MTASKELITVHVNVENAKKIAGRDEKGVYRVDTADWVGKMISNFLLKNNFEDYTKDIENMKKNKAVS